jgi:translation initiation factor IF-2
VVEDWGGDTISVPVSAKEKTGISELLENVLLVSEMEDLKADATKPAVGVVIEAKMDKTKGALTTVLVHNGTLRVGDTVVVGNEWGRVKAMFNDAGKQVRKAEPSTPVEILGLGTVAGVGDTLTAVAGERQARALIAKKQSEEKTASPAQKAINLTSLYDQVSSGEIKDLNVILKADVQGSIEPIKASLEELSNDEVKVRVIQASTGNVSESDIMLASASKGIVVGFNTGAEQGAQRMAEAEGISIRHYSVIYTLIDDVSKALKGMLEPTFVEVVDGRAETRAVFPSGKRDKVAGVYVTDGKVTRGVNVRVLRKGEVIADSTVSSLKRFKDDAREVATGYECGVGVRDFNDVEVGDILEFYRMEESV